MKTTLLPLCFTFCFVLLQAQQNSLEITGSVIDLATKQPIPFATNLVGEKATLQPLTGVTTMDDGSFTVLSPSDDIYVEISFIGYEPVRLENIATKGKLMDIGTIALSEQSEMLNEVEVSGEKSTMEFKLDKRVFNVGKDLSSTGASALEVLDNVPSVTVSIEGQVRLRGNAGVQILINGKPSVLTSEGGNALGSITAEMIEKVEVITNPSAKYEAEGTAGIINIVIKKDERKGDQRFFYPQLWATGQQQCRPESQSTYRKV